MSLQTDKPLNPDKFFPWIQELVAEDGPGILRSKGILAFKDDPDRFVFQGVHMILDGDHQRPWKDDEKRESRLVFIGRHLPEEKIRTGFEDACLSFASSAWPFRERCTGPRMRLRLPNGLAPAVGRPDAAGDRRIHFLGDAAPVVHPLARGDGRFVLVAPRGRSMAQQRIALHDGGILSSAGDGARIVTGGDDGKVVEIDAAGATRTVFADPKKQVDRSCRARPGRRRRLVGRQARAASPIARARPKSLELASTAGGLAFAPKGFRLAIAHYNGASLWFPNAQAKPEVLEWKGSHLGVTVSPDGRFLVTTMQEPMLHGWRHRRRQAHAHVGLFGARALVRLDRGRRLPRDRRLRPAHPVAVLQQGRADGQAADACSRRMAASSTSSPAIRNSRWWPRAMRTAWCCWCGSTTAPRCWCIRPNSTRRSPRWPGALTGCSSPSPARTGSRVW